VGGGEYVVVCVFVYSVWCQEQKRQNTSYLKDIGVFLFI
jgi:hypothetical protein